MKGWKAIASALLLLVGISGAASAQDWSHQNQRDTYSHNYQIQQRDRDDNWNRTRTDGWYGNQQYGWQTWRAPRRSYRPNRDNGYSRIGDRGRNDDRR